MTDPSTALQSFQQALLHGGIQLQRGVLDPDLYVYVDKPNGETRFTYVRLEGKTVTAFVEFAWCQPIEGTPCLAIGYAVPEAHRKEGRAKEAISAALSEMQHGLGRNGLSVFYVEAIVGADNKPSQRVAEQVISDTPLAVTDQTSGLPAFRYLRRIEHPTAN
jgi:GNAT acetyltransferase-like protein